MKRTMIIFMSCICLIALMFPVNAGVAFTDDAASFSDLLIQSFFAVNKGELSQQDFIDQYNSLRGTKGFNDYYAYLISMEHDFKEKDYIFQFCVDPAYEKPNKNYVPADFSEHLIKEVKVITEDTDFAEAGPQWTWDVVYVFPSEGNEIKLFQTLLESDYAILAYPWPAEGFISAPPLPGDADNDGAVTAMDARLILRASVGYDEIQPGTRAFTNADLNGDGTLTAAEAREVLRMSVA